MINLGASSDSLIINDETDFGPLVSFELNSLFPSSLGKRLASRPSKLLLRSALQDFIGKLGVVILLGKNMKEFGHGLREMLEVGQTLDNRGLCSCYDVSFLSNSDHPQRTYQMPVRGA